jgi:hypothetical protein
LRPLHISYDFRAGRTYLLDATFGGERRGSELFYIKPKITVVADDTSSSVETVPRKGTGYTAAGGTVYDAQTKLTWQQTVSATVYTWADAKAYCAGVGTSLGGTGWRLPTIGELRTIVDNSRANPSIDSTAFPATPVDRFWSSSLVASSPSNAWAVYFDSGQEYSFGLALTSHVRCVRCCVR